MKTCEGCIHENLKNMGWASSLPHPCTNCRRICPEPVDKYQPDLRPKEELKTERMTE